MECKQKFIRLLAVLTFGIAAVSFSMTGMDEAVTHSELQANHLSCIPHNAPAPPSQTVFGISENRTASDPFARLFQLMFILFLISPPIIALMLFLIWQELKERNKLK